MPFQFLHRESLTELARQVSLTAYSPTLELSGLLPGIDNVRHDVHLSPIFTHCVQQHIHRLLARYGNVEDLVAVENSEVQQIATPSFLYGKVEPPKPQPKAKPGGDPGDFKRYVTDLMIVALNRAKTEGNVSLDLLARLALIKLLRTELGARFNAILERLRGKQAEYETRRAGLHKALEMRERCAAFQLAKSQVLRKAGQELFTTLREVEKETLARMRRALFGTELPDYSLLLNRLMFTENGRDDYINAEHYVMMGNYDRDPDRFGRLQEISRVFLATLDLPIPPGQEQLDLDALLSVPENAHELVASGNPDEATPKSRAQRGILSAWTDTLERNDVLDHIIAAYEAAALLEEYSPVIHPQQLKVALIDRTERMLVERLLEEHTRMSPANFQAAQRRVGTVRTTDRAKVAGRFLLSFMSYHRDLRSLEALNQALDSVNLIINDRLRELSSINSTLYEFTLPQEQQPVSDKPINHVILKADVRDSSILIRSLMDRGLNPASYFSLNFYDPVNKLLSKYEATKVFIEGDAIILAIFGHEGNQGFPVARTCVLAREMMSIVHAYNELSMRDDLPRMELGIGISYQDSAPMYLMDGNSRIMISRALNVSDRLSSCNKGARRYLSPGQGLFNVYLFKTVDDADTGGNPDEFLMRYNVGGINVEHDAFLALQQEISLQRHDVEIPNLWDSEIVHLYSGLVPLGGGMFHRIVIREANIPHIDASDFSFKSWTEEKYYEVCTSDAIYEYIENIGAPSSKAMPVN